MKTYKIKRNENGYTIILPNDTELMRLYSSIRDVHKQLSKFIFEHIINGEPVQIIPA